MRSKEKPAADSRVQFSLRLPADLHARLVERADLVPLNSFIVHSLETSLRADEAMKTAQALLRQSQELRQGSDKLSDFVMTEVQKFTQQISGLAKDLVQATNENQAISTVLLAFISESQQQLPAETYEAIRKAVLKALSNEPLTDSVRKALEGKL